MTVEEMYRGIIPAAPALTTRPVQSVAINPATGMPYAPTASARAGYGIGAGGGASGSLTVPRPNQPSGSIVTAKDESRLTPNAFGYGTNGVTGGNPAIAAIDRAAPNYGGYVASPRFTPPKVPSGDDGIIDLSSLSLSDIGGQRMADSEGKPIRDKSGRVFYPGGKGPGGNVSGSMSAPDRRGPLGKMLGLKAPGLPGLFGALFGAPSGGGLFGGAPSGGAPANRAPTYATTPFQEDRFQTTTGAQMPASMNNDRWKTGY
jgi:hypothetical protein